MTNEHLFGISRKVDSLVRYVEIFGNFKSRMSDPFVFPPGISGVFDRIVSSSTIFGFSENFTRKFQFHLMPVWKFSEFLVEWKASLIS